MLTWQALMPEGRQEKDRTAEELRRGGQRNPWEESRELLVRRGGGDGGAKGRERGGAHGTEWHPVRPIGIQGRNCYDCC